MSVFWPSNTNRCGRGLRGGDSSPRLGLGLGLGFRIRFLGLGLGFFSRIRVRVKIRVSDKG